jgi:GT2 family glycosyltransferase
VINLLGGELPKDLIAPGKSNRKGFWESAAVNRLNDEILAAANMTWRDWGPWERGRGNVGRLSGLRTEALTLLRNEFASSRFFVLKDPRICRLIGFWQEALAAFGADPVVVSIVRNPLEVATSLESRNGMEPALSHLVWLRYVLEAELATRALPRSFTSYDRLLADWRIVAERIACDARLSWPHATDEAAAEIDSFLSTEDRHHEETPDAVADSSLPEWLRTAYAIFDRWASSHEDPSDRPELDRIREEFNRAAPAFSTLADHVSERRVRKLKQALGEAVAESAKQSAAAEAGTARLREAGEELAIARNELEGLRGQAAAQVVRADELDSAAARLRGDLDLERKKRAAAEEALERARSDLDGLVARADQAEETIADQKAELRRTRSNAQKTARELRKSLRETSHELALVREQAAVQAAKLSGLEDNAARLQRDLDAERKKRVAAQRALKRTRSDLAGLAARAEQAEGTIADQTAELRRIRSSAEETAGELRKSLRETGRELALVRKEAAVRTAKLADLEGNAAHLQRNLDVERKKRASFQETLERLRAERAELVARTDQAEQAGERLEAELRQIRSSRTWRIASRVTKAADRARRIASPRRVAPQSGNTDLIALVGASALFDRDWYLARYPDVAADGADAATHYVLFGAAEGRDPGPGFSTKHYLEAHTDVARAGVNPLAHYLQFGHQEGRLIVPSSDGTVQPQASTAEEPVAAAPPLSFLKQKASEPQWRRQADFTRSDDDATFELAGVLLGTIATETHQITPAVDNILPAIADFCRLIGKEAEQELRCDAGRTDTGLAAAIGRLLSWRAPVLSFQGGNAATVITDIWFVNDRDLRIRLGDTEEAGVGPRVVRFFRVDGSGKPAMAAESLPARGIAFLDVPLANPFMPVLATVTTPEGRLLAASLIPFPSLCRGGLHYAELSSAGVRENYLDSLREYSSGLLSEALDNTAGTKRSISHIEVDLRGASGAEHIFSRDVREWLDVVMGIDAGPATPTAAITSAGLSYLEQSLAPAKGRAGRNRRKRSALGLVLPADAIPSVKALVSHQIGSGGAPSLRAGSFVIAESATTEPRWSVTVPPLDDGFGDLQPATARPGYPFLKRASSTARSAAQGEPIAFPLAVMFRATRSSDESRLLMTLAPDSPSPLLRKGMTDRDRDGATVSVLLPVTREARALATFLESLRLQTLADKVDVVAVVDTSKPDRKAAAKEMLRRLFPGRHLVVEHDGALGPSAAINRAALRAGGKFMLLASEDIVLHDPRSLETLCRIADHDDVASAGCVLVRDGATKGRGVTAFRSGGIFLSSGEATGNGPRFSEPDCHASFPAATYPVVGNALTLFMVRADNWRTVGGLDAAAFPDTFADIDYGVRALARGFRNLCTSAVSAALTGAAPRAPYADAEPALGAAMGRDDIARRTSMLRTLRG